MKKFTAVEQNKIWVCFVEQCLSGNITAMRLYFEMLANDKKAPNQPQVVILSGADEIKE